MTKRRLASPASLLPVSVLLAPHIMHTLSVAPAGYNVAMAQQPAHRSRNSTCPDGEEVTTPIDHSDFPTVEHLVVLRTPEPGHDSPASAGAPRSSHGQPMDLVSQAAFAPLMLELMAKAHRVAVVDDAPTVMVELHRGAQAVVLVDYPQAPATTELIAAVTRYYPRVSLWQAQADVHHGSSTLSRIVSTASVSATSQPHMMLDDAHDHTTSSEPRHIGGTTALVSDEELAMLMSPFDDDSER